jgi:hypothetical protein
MTPNFIHTNTHLSGKGSSKDSIRDSPIWRCPASMYNKHEDTQINEHEHRTWYLGRAGVGVVALATS